MRSFRQWFDDKITVDKFNTWQFDPNLHPFTCGNDSEHLPLYLIVSRDDILPKYIMCCYDCDYTQIVPWYFWEYANRLYGRKWYQTLLKPIR